MNKFTILEQLNSNIGDIIADTNQWCKSNNINFILMLNQFKKEAGLNGEYSVKFPVTTLNTTFIFTGSSNEAANLHSYLAAHWSQNIYLKIS